MPASREPERTEIEPVFGGFEENFGYIKSNHC